MQNSNTKKSTKFSATLALAVGAALSPSGQAANVTWVGPFEGEPPVWNDGGNWDQQGAIPQAGDDVFLLFPNDSRSQLVQYVNLGNNPLLNSVLVQGTDRNMTLDQQQDALSTLSLVLDGAGGRRGVYNLGGSGTLTTANTTVGDTGGGTFNQSGGTHTVTGTLTLGAASSGNGNYNLSDAGNLTTANTIVGDGGAGTFNQTGGIHTVTDTLTVGGIGRYIFAGGTLQAGSIVNRGTFEQKSVLTSAGAFDNQGTFANTGTFANQGNLSNTGTVTNQNLINNLAGGTLTNAAGGTLSNSDTLNNQGTFIQQGTLVNLSALNNLASGTLTNAAGGTLTNGGTLNNQGAFIQQGTLANAGAIANSGQFTLASGSQTNGAGSYTQSAGTTTVAGSLQANLVDNRAGTFTLAGGTLQATQLINSGTFHYSSGNLIASLNNQGSFNLSGAGTRVISGDVVNTGTFKVTDTTVQYTGHFDNQGAYLSDPSTNRFNDLSVGANGYLLGGDGDTFEVAGDFRNASTQASRWDTSRSSLIFGSPGDGGGDHTMELAGVDRGAKASGFNNNFSWGKLTLDSGNRLTLADGNATPGAALYARRVVLPGGVSQLQNISSDYNVYFDPSVRANRSLLGGLSFGEGSGHLLPWSFVPGLNSIAQGFGLTPNQQSFAAALDEACTRPTGELATRCIELQRLTPEQKKQAVASLTPDQVPSQAGITIKFRAVRLDAPLARLAQLRSGGTAPLSFNFNGVSVSPDKLAQAFGRNTRGGGASADTAALDNMPFRDNPLGIFVQARFNFGDQDFTSFERGFNFETRAVTVGTDYRFSDDLVAGLAFNYTSTAAHYAQASGNLDSDSFMGAFYGSYTLPMDFYVDWLASYGGQNYIFNRLYRYPGFSSQTSTRPDGDQYNLSLSSGKDIAWNEWQFSPYIRAEYTNLSINAYEERGGGGLQVNVAGQTSHSFVSDLGTQISRAISLPFGVITPAVRVEWEHQYLNDNRGIGMRLADAAPGLGNFTLQTGTPDRDYINLGSSVSAALPNGGAAFLRYETRLGQSDLSQHLVELGVRMQF